MSPEQIRNEAIDERTDVYSLAATLWHLLTLHRPYSEPNAHEKILAGERTSLRLENASIPRELEPVVNIAMDRERDRRYRDMQSLAADLLAVLERRPISARPLPASLRIVRWCQRHRVAATIAVANLVSLVILPVALSIQQRIALTALTAEKSRAESSPETALAAIDAVLVKLGSQKLRDVPAADQLSIEVLTEAIGFYRRFYAIAEDRDRLLQPFGRALCQLGAAQEMAGKLDYARATLREAIELLSEDRTDLPHRVVEVRGKARLNLSSVLYTEGNLAEARASAEAAARDFSTISGGKGMQVAGLPGRAEAASVLARVDEALSADPDSVEVLHRQALDLQRNALAQSPDDALDQRHEVRRG